MDINTIQKTDIKKQENKSKSLLKGEYIRFVPLGGLDEIGRNMAYYEFEDDIVIIDMGLQFPEEETPGIDFIVPNINSLLHKKDKIRGIIITHGHYDHIGAIPYLIEQLGNPPIYATDICKAIIEKRQQDFVNAPKLNTIAIKPGDVINISSNFKIEFFELDHTIPETIGVLLKTPLANIAHFGDFRIEYDVNDKPSERNIEVFKKLNKVGIDVLLLDSTNAEEKGHSVSEKIVEKNLYELFKEAEGRIILATFSSMITRIAEIIKMAEKLHKKIAINGRSMKDNIQIAQKLGYINAKQGTIIPLEDLHNYKDDRILILTTGAQGESGAGLMKIISGGHKYIRLKKGDTVIFSSSVIPGNERSIQSLRDNIARQGAKVIHSNIIDIHASGHAPAEDIKLVLEAVKPKYFIPIHGYYYMRTVAGDIAKKAGMSQDKIIILENGQIAYILKNKVVATKDFVQTSYVMIDGLGIGDVGEVVLRDRLTLAKEGMVSIYVLLSKQTGQILRNPDIMTKGFIYAKENQEILENIRRRVKGILGRVPKHQPLDIDYVRALLRDQIGQYLYNITHRRPMILITIAEI
ncbi:MAG: ribonuclease J [Minisyncoccia bacterium]